MSEYVDGTEIVIAPDGPPARALRRRVREHLAAGRLVALPTETVYGIAARADDGEAIRSLRELKDRPAEVALTWHVGTREAVESFEPLQPLARRLAKRYWPGPLTLILRGVPDGLDHMARDGWTGLRLPAHRATSGLLGALDFPVVMSSANPHGGTPCTEAREVAERFSGRLALVVDGGPARIGESSGVLRVGPGRFELHREGLLPLADLQRTAGLRLGFACTGNTCRSPMAEVLARSVLEERLGIAESVRAPDATATEIGDFGFEIRSMGVFAGTGAPASGHAFEVMEERGLDLDSHRSRPALPEDVRELDAVYCMTSSHVDTLRRALPPSRSRDVQHLDPEGGDIPDPIGGSRDTYRQCADLIARALEARIDEWA